LFNFYVKNQDHQRKGLRIENLNSIFMNLRSQIDGNMHKQKNEIYFRPDGVTVLLAKLLFYSK
jgi:hypothetical protein